MRQLFLLNTNIFDGDFQHTVQKFNISIRSILQIILVFYNILLIFPLLICFVENKHENSGSFTASAPLENFNYFKELKASRPKWQ